MALRAESRRLTSTNAQILQEHGQLVQHSSEQEEEKLNMSQTIRSLEEENSLLREELVHLRRRNRELLETNDQLRREIHNRSRSDGADLQEVVAELQQQNGNLSVTLVRQRQEAAEQEMRWREEMGRVGAELRSAREAFRSLDSYCPVVYPRTEGTAGVHVPFEPPSPNVL